ncbi:MAG: NACHT domain-containing protein [Symplocastrum torsivum CPER-KK1]|jgi:predicted NACHT family NTPase|uniref:NACHT domain-containing protein n=1 Tax=Symplocastrum torsivum CPER-KK1 TaxID=450513 RepID=A0A951PRE5_9CYAN|nr:NACHT domain-containing protein [Symplocastrum torsivum CPER-KK1]
MARKSLRVSPEKLEKIKRAFASTGFTQANLASEVDLSTRQPIGKFLSGKAVDHNVFKEICFKLNLEWKEVADLPRDIEPELEEKKQDSTQPLKQGKNSIGWNLAQQMRTWFETVGYSFEKHEIWEDSYFEWIINIPAWRRLERILVRGIQGEAKISDVVALRQAVNEQRTDQGCLVAVRRISRAARNEVEKEENQNLACYTFDELLDEKADFSPYINWLEAEVKRKGIDTMYVPLACTKEEFDPTTKEKIEESRYDESEGWIEGYIDRWLADPAKEHISVLGEFGTGKTWFVLHYAWITLQKYLQAKKRGVERPRLPLVIPLRDYAKALNVESVLAGFFFNKHNIRLNSSVFDQLNRMGKLLLIFDGFDEMADKIDRQKMIDNFWELAKVVVPGSKAILTCRTEHFPEAQEGRALLNAELKASITNLTGEPPQFEVLKLEYFNDDQIRKVISFRAEPATVEQVMGNPQLLNLARRPVMTELILEALPDIEAGKPVDISRIYLYAVRHKMERDIKAERTFTSLADKLYFLCELSWEMLSTDQMSLNYRQFPDHLRRLFGHAVQEQKDLDHWRYDMLGQTLLIRNDDGDYTPAHRSFLEFFVAYKFAAELGILAPDFTELAQGQLPSYLDASAPPQDYRWSSYFRREVDKHNAIKPKPALGKFVGEEVDALTDTLGRKPLTTAILDLIQTMFVLDEKEVEAQLLTLIEATRGKTTEEVSFVGGNVATLLVCRNPLALKGRNLAHTNLCHADFAEKHWLPSLRKYCKATDLSETNLEGACLQNVEFAEVALVNANLAYASLDNSVGFLSERHFYEMIALSPDGKFLVAGGIEGSVKLWFLEDGSEETIIKDMAWIACLAISFDNKLISIGDNMGDVVVYNIATSELILKIHDHEDCVADITFDRDSHHVITVSGGNEIDNSLRVYRLSDGELIDHYEHNRGFAKIEYCYRANAWITLDYNHRVDLWSFEENQHIKKLKLPKFFTNQAKFIDFSISTDKDSHLLLGGWNYKVKKNVYQIYNIENLDLIWQSNSFPVDLGKSLFAELSPNRHVIAFVGKDYILVWDRVKDQELWRSHKHLADIESLTFSQDSKYLVTGSRDCTVRMWNLDDGMLIKTFVTSKNYRGLQLTGVTGLSEEMLEALKERSAII